VTVSSSFEPARRSRTSPAAIIVRDERGASERLADAALRFEQGDAEAALWGYADAVRQALAEKDVALAAAALDGAMAAMDVPADADAFTRARAAIEAGIAADAGRVWDALCARGGRRVDDAAACAAALRFEEA
jgi:hypothetical protein